MKIYIGSDHAGFELKNKLVAFLEGGNKYEVIDLGPHHYDKQDDYPELIAPVAQAVSLDKNAKGIIIGGSGQGEAIVANRFKGIRAVVFYGTGEQLNLLNSSKKEEDSEIIKLSRAHNDANILSLGARFLDDNEAKEAVQLWLETPFSGEERHKRRIAKIDSKLKKCKM
ncbi:RpiB/LacA/LacB family sugar-phosphate isomerase [Patescibacteria group bacterium]|nr:RpiB/LacA/LacB family sugar-phosphate isomerase [Patescibacteria group bacterium]MBU1730031.1 RpiB/LacA/LacB family sugar-phosphate isomerase [Patescibacteria group bacterium]MBU1956240.1 RpiB/LacA/LacB family sugar-phosphate isomerase [Patescibacteria group bacterium]MBU2010100.1 RpiB/LacA/LacB family sugar-phosphate isomerase [Patescibacteria group bacterium]MBU2416921.1 RpiB/LacA/LacB family sugar-phosphate isomerase [Patescibacteria group bacterium]